MIPTKIRIHKSQIDYDQQDFKAQNLISKLKLFT